MPRQVVCRAKWRNRSVRKGGILAGLWSSLPVGDLDFDLPQQGHNLLRLEPLDGHDRSSSKEILPHFTW
jgi:hypothetical protein